MKPLYYLVGAVIILVLSAYGLQAWLHAGTSELLGALDSVVSAVEAGEWSEATRLQAELTSTWEERKGLWILLLNHQEIDNIDISIARIERYIAHSDRVLAEAELAVLKHLFEHIPEKESFSLQNVF